MSGVRILGPFEHRDRVWRIRMLDLLVSRHSPVRHVVAVLAVIVALLLRVALSGFFGTRVAFITFYPAVMVVAMLCGLVPGLVATAASALLAWYWILTPEGAFLPLSFPDGVSLVVFSGMGVFMSIVAVELILFRGVRAALWVKPQGASFRS